MLTACLQLSPEAPPAHRLVLTLGSRGKRGRAGAPASFLTCAEAHRRSGPRPPVASEHLVSGAPGGALGDPTGREAESLYQPRHPGSLLPGRKSWWLIPFLRNRILPGPLRSFRHLCYFTAKSSNEQDEPGRAQWPGLALRSRPLMMQERVRAPWGQ